MTDSVKAPYPEYTDRSPDWAICRACDKGGREVRDAGTTYLPRPAGMPNTTAGDAAYAFYRNSAPFFNGFGRALNALHGMVFRREPTIILPPAMEVWATRATRSGRSLTQAIRSDFRQLLVVGRVGILPDAPEREPGRMYSVAEVERLGLVPYLVTYRAEDILHLGYGMVNGRRMLTHARLRERFQEPDPRDEFLTIEGMRWRVLDLIPADGRAPDPSDRFNARTHVYRQRVYEQIEAADSRTPSGVILKSETIPQLDRGRPLDYIPLEVVDADGEPDDGEIAPPPMLDLAEHNIALYRVMADLRHGQWFSAFPQAVIKGADIPEGTDLTVGSPVAWNLGSKHSHADAFFLTHDGKGLGSLEKEREELRREMAMLGLRMLEPDRRQVEAAETASIHRQGEMSILQSLAQLYSDAITRTVERVARWQGIGGEVSIELNQDFVPAGMDHLKIRVLLEAVVAGKISEQTFYEALVEHEAIRPGRNWEEERALIMSEALALAGDAEDEPDDEPDDEDEMEDAA